jgi:hypothetical protein
MPHDLPLRSAVRLATVLRRPAPGAPKHFGASFHRRQLPAAPPPVPAGRILRTFEAFLHTTGSPSRAGTHSGGLYRARPSHAPARAPRDPRTSLPGRPEISCKLRARSPPRRGDRSFQPNSDEYPRLSVAGDVLRRPSSCTARAAWRGRKQWAGNRLTPPPLRSTRGRKSPYVARGSEPKDSRE